MDVKSFKKLTSRILRHSGFITHSNKITEEYELKSAAESEPILFCKMINIDEDGNLENYLCFRAIRKLTEDEEKLYNKMIKRFTRLGPSINISLEDETEPPFTDEQMETLESLIKEYDKGDENNEPTEI